MCCLIDCVFGCVWFAGLRVLYLYFLGLCVDFGWVYGACLMVLCYVILYEGGLVRFLFVVIWCCCLCLLLIIGFWYCIWVVGCGAVALVVVVFVRGVCVGFLVWCYLLCGLGLFCKMAGWLTCACCWLLVGLAIVLCFVSIDAVLIVLCIASLGGLRLYLLFSAFLWGLSLLVTFCVIVFSICCLFRCCVN